MRTGLVPARCVCTKMYYVWAWLAAVAVLVAGSRAVQELSRSDEVFGRLLRAQRETVLFVYSTGCGWCDRLAVELSELEGLFPQVSFLQVNGEGAQQLVQRFQIASYPQLLVFRPATEGDEEVRQLITGVYRGVVDRGELATFLVQTMGIIPEWPHRVQPLERLKQSEHVGGSRVLWFVTPYMEEYYLKLLLGDPATSLIDQLAQRFSALDFYLVDSSRAHLAGFSNSLRLTNFPTVALVLGGQRVVIVDLFRYDREIMRAEFQVLSTLIEARYDWGMMQKLASKFHSVHCYESVQELQSLVALQRVAEQTPLEETDDWDAILDADLWDVPMGS